MGHRASALCPFFMEIIIPPKRFSVGDRWKAIERELRTGLELKKATEAKREAIARQSAHSMRGAGKVPGLGRNVGVMPSWEYFRLLQKYGHKEVHSREFLKDFQKKNPDLAVHKL